MRLRPLAGAQYQRQRSVGCKHNLLRVVPFYVCKSNLGGHCHFFDCDEEAAFVSLVADPNRPLFSYAKDQCQRCTRAGAKITKRQVWPIHEEYFGRAGTGARVPRSTEAASVRSCAGTNYERQYTLPISRTLRS